MTASKGLTPNASQDGRFALIRGTERIALRLVGVACEDCHGTGAIAGRRFTLWRGFGVALFRACEPCGGTGVLACDAGGDRS